MISSSIAIDEMEKEQPTDVVSHNVEAFQQETVREKSGTLKDAEDMQRLGRIQELRVRWIVIEATATTDSVAAKLQLCEHLRICHDLDEYMAGPSCVCCNFWCEDRLRLTIFQLLSFRDSQWRYCRPALWLHHQRILLHLR